MKKNSRRAAATCGAISLSLLCFPAANAQEVAPPTGASTREASIDKSALNAALLAAIGANNLDEVKSVLRNGADPNARVADSFLTPALSVLNKNTDLEITRALLDAGADIEATDAPGNAPLALAALRNRPEIIALLLQRGANLEGNKFKGLTALMIAASSGSIASVRALLDAGAKVNARSDSNGTALFYGAAVQRNLAVIKMLAAAGADVSVTADNGKRAVDVAADSGNFEINDYLVAIYNRDNALLGAAAQAAGISGGAPTGSWSEVEKALDAGANGRFANAAGTTPLMLLTLDATGFNEKAARRLIAFSDVNAQESGGNSALHLAADRRNLPILTLLLAFKAAPNLKNKDGQTPLDVALSQKSEDAAALLRAAGAQTSTASTPRVAPTPAPTTVIPTPASPVQNPVAPIATAPATNATAPQTNAPAPSATVQNVPSATTPNATAPGAAAPPETTPTTPAPTATKPTAPSQTAPPAVAPTALDFLNEYERSPLMQTARDGNVAEIARLLQRGAQVDFANESGQTALFFAALGNSASAIKALAQAGANLEAKDKNGESALVVAAFRGEAATLRALVEAGAPLRDLDAAIAKARSGMRGAVERAQRATSTAAYNYLVSLKK